MFAFQGTPGGSLNPKEFWVENCNMNERFLWLNKQDVEPLWLSVEEVPGDGLLRTDLAIEAPHSHHVLADRLDVSKRGAGVHRIVRLIIVSAHSF